MAEEDRISAVFKESTVFITGGSGFLGKLLIEKLLRSTEVQKVYILLRNKKGKTSEERLNDIFSNVVFDLLKRLKPNILTKCQVIPGDITCDDLGISSENRQLLENEVNFIYNLAASTRFDNSVKTAVECNTKSTKHMLELAKKCRNLKAFVHVSTSYAFPEEKMLYEKSYKPPADPHRLIDAVSFASDEECDKLIGDSPNTYTFSKALAEALVVEQMDKLPVIIARPSVVCPTLQEPLPGWCNNLQGPMGLFVGAGKGIIRSMYMKGDASADFIPADFVASALIVTTWNYLNNSKKDRIIHVTSSAQYNYSWHEIINTGKKIIYNEVPFNGVVWYPGGSIKKSRFLHNICFYLFQLLPAILIDCILMVLGYKPILYQIQRRIEKGGVMFEYYTTKCWNFDNSTAIQARNRMNSRERNVYVVDDPDFDLRTYLKNCLMCVRRNNLKEPDDSLAAARRHMKIMWTVDIIFKLLLVLAVLFYFHTYFLKDVIRFGPKK